MMKIILTFSLLLFVGCQTTISNNAISYSIDVERLTNAKLILYKSDVTKSDIKKAREYLNAIPSSSTEYNEAQSLLKSLEQKKISSNNESTDEKPFIGMWQSDFTDLCGGHGDRQTRQISGRTVTVYINQYKDFAKSCGGVFTFVDSKLDTIGDY